MMYQDVQPLLENEYSDSRITIRRYTSDDLAARLAAIQESAAEISRWLPRFHLNYSKQDNLDWFESCEKGWRDGAVYHFAILHSEQRTFIGECLLNHINTIHRFANIAYWIRNSETGKGYACGAVRLIARFGFDQLGLHRLEIFMGLENIASQRVAEKAGAKREGVLRNRVMHDRPEDAYMYSLIPEDLA